jgi:hypothetical protein
MNAGGADRAEDDEVVELGVAGPPSRDGSNRPQDGHVPSQASTRAPQFGHVAPPGAWFSVNVRSGTVAGRAGRACGRV